MDKQEILKIYKDFRTLILQKRLIEAFTKLQLLLHDLSNQYYNVQFDKHKETYQNILNYSLLAGKDPEKEKILTKLYRNVLELGDRAKEAAMTKVSGLQSYKTKWQIENEKQDEYQTALAKLEEVGISADISDVLQDIAINSGIKAENALDINTLDKIFEYFWLQDNLSKK